MTNEHRQAWKRARLSRDPRFDGRFFIAVKTTGIYCRPVCPARPPQEKNVLYFSSAAAAAEAGFRPCLRCRPETSPGTPAWAGTSSTVARAMRLIADSALDDGNVDELADRLGIGSRHLRRLFLQHLGATPVAVAQTRRLHFAKRLIDELTDVHANCARVRIRQHPPLQRNVSKFVWPHADGIAAVIAPFGRTERAATVSNCDFAYRSIGKPCWYFSLPRAIPGVEVVDAESYRRTIAARWQVRRSQHGWMSAGKPSICAFNFPSQARCSALSKERGACSISAPIPLTSPGISPRSAAVAQRGTPPGSACTWRMGRI